MLGYFFIQLFLVIVLVEAFTELVIKSQIFAPFRKWVSRGDWLRELFSCGYCFSVWVALGVVFLTQTSYPLMGNHWVDLFLTAIVAHRCANVLHNIIDKWTDKYYSLAHVNSEKPE